MFPASAKPSDFLIAEDATGLGGIVRMAKQMNTRAAPTRRMAAEQDPNFQLQTLYLNVRRLAELAGESVVTQVIGRFANTQIDDKVGANARLGALGRVLRDWLWQNRNCITRFERLALTGKLKRGSLFVVERDFYCRNVVPRVRASREPSRMTARFVLPSRDVELRMITHSDHVAPGSAGAMLTGRVSGIFVVGVVNKVGRSAIDANTVFVGNYVDLPSTDVGRRSPWDNRVHVEQIDEFARCSGQAFAREYELRKLHAIPEEKVKKAFAQLLNEDSVPKDWGGERSDLFTTRIHVDGRRVSASFAFKGPAKFHPMKLADLGKNGDQIDRLLTEPAQLLVLQHCHRVTAPVINLMKAYANQIGNERAYCVIDGGDTLRILRAYGLCGQKSKLKPEPRAQETESDEPLD